MSSKTGEEILVNGNVDEICEIIKKYLQTVNLKPNKIDISEDEAKIVVHNPQKSFIELFLSQCLQIVEWHIKRTPDNQVQIGTKFNQFKKYRVLYYTVLSFLIISIITCFIIFSEFSELARSSPLIFAGIILILPLFSIMWVYKPLSSNQSAEFLTQLYEILHKNGFSYTTVLHVDASGTKNFIGPYAFIIVMFLFYCINYDRFNYIFIDVLFIVSGLVGLLVFSFILNPAMIPKLELVMIGFSLCIPLSFYGNIPTLNYLLKDVVYDMESAHRKYIDMSSELSNKQGENLKLGKIYVAGYRNRKNIFLAIILFSWIAFMFVIVWRFFAALKLPIIILRDLKNFRLFNPDSDYYKALAPSSSKSSWFFGCTIFLFWLLMSVGNTIGIFFSFYLLERVLFDINYLFVTNMGSVFFENTKTVVGVILQPIMSQNSIDSFHSTILIIYSIPMLLMFFLVLNKNVTSFIKDILLLKRKSDKYSKIEEQIIKKVTRICDLFNVSIPVIKVINSPLISAEAKSLGFPIFKNFLVVTNGAWENLHEFDGELDALLAHEIGHFKKHTLKRKLLCIFSDYSFFGNGFLAVLQSPFQLEREADRIALKWLKHLNKQVNAFISLLEKQEENNMIHKKYNKHSNEGDSLNFAMLRDDTYRENLLESYDKSSNIKKMWVKLKALYRMYFGREILSYIHPPISQRIAWLQEEEF